MEHAMKTFSGQKRIAAYAVKKRNGELPDAPPPSPKQGLQGVSYPSFASAQPLTEETLLALISWDGIALITLRQLASTMPNGHLLDRLLKKLEKDRKIRSDYMGPAGNRTFGWKRRSY